MVQAAPTAAAILTGTGMSNGLLRRVLAIQSFILGLGILIFVLFFGRAGDNAVETLKAIGVVLGLAIYLVLSLRVYELLKSPDADSRTSAIGTLLCLPTVAYFAFHLFLLRGA
jgi:hypothetical protein